MSDIEILGLFPIPVARFCLNREFTDEERNFVNNLERRPNFGNETSINSKVLEETALKDVRDFCLQSTIKFFNEAFKPRDDLSIYITQSWLNYTTKTQYHHEHNHGNSFISGVLYINADPLTDKINFHKFEAHNNLILKFSSTDAHLYNAETWWAPSGTGVLYLFPSYLRHSVPVLHDENYQETRISLSFNTFLSGKLGDNTQLTELILQ